MSVFWEVWFCPFLGESMLFFAFLPLHLFKEKELAQWNTCENKHSGRKWETQFHKKVNGNVIFIDVQSLSFQMFANNGMLLAITIVIFGLLLYLSSLHPHHHQVQFNKYNLCSIMKNYPFGRKPSIINKMCALIKDIKFYLSEDTKV